MKTFLLVITLVLTFGWAKAQDLPPFEFEDDNVPWPGLGSVPGFAMDAEGNLYISVTEETNPSWTAIRKYEDGQWSTFAEDTHTWPPYEALFAVAPDGTLYLTQAAEGQAVSRWNGTGWEAAGTFERNIWVVSLTVAPDGTPYAAFRDSIHDGDLTVLALEDGTWQTVGDAGFTETLVDDEGLVIAPDGTPYIVGRTWESMYHSVVMKLNDDTWETVGSLDMPEGAGFAKLAFAEDGTPYLAYADSLNDYKATVMKFEDSEWQAVGEPGFSAAGTFPDIVVDDEGIPYVAYSDSSLDRRIIVKKFTGSTWETVGNAGFSDFNAIRPSILISPSGTPYVAYADMFNLVDEYVYTVRVARLGGDTWESVGNGDLFSGIRSIPSLAAGNDGSLDMAYHYDYWFDPSFEDWQKTKIVKWKDGTLTDLGDVDYFKGIERIKIALSPDQTLYMAYVDSASEYKTSVFKLVGDNWEAMGSPIDSNSSFDLDIGSTGTVYLTLGTNVWTFDGSDWEAVSEEVFSESPTYTQTAVDTEGTLYVAFNDADNEYRPTVKKLVGSVWEDITGEVTEGNPVFLSTDENNTLYIGSGIYNEVDNTTSFRFMKSEDSNWETIETDISGFSIYNIVMDSQGTFFVSIKDEEKETSVITFNDSGQETLVDNDLLKGHFPFLEVDKMGNLYMAFELDNIVVYKYGLQCTNPTNGGTIAGSQSGCDAFDPEMITSSDAPSGHSGTLEYKWQSSTTGSEEGYTDIDHNAATYDPGILNQTTWFRRLVKVTCSEDWTGAAVSDVVTMTVVTLPGLNCPDDDTVFNDPGRLYARKSYSALPDGTPDTLAIYMVDGKTITFPYDFPMGTTTVEVKANSKCAVDVACSFTVTVTAVTGLEDWDAAGTTISVYPNPFTQEMAIEITNPLLKEVSVEIYSISGQKIRTLAKAQKGANISLTWDGTNEKGKQVPHGMYLLKVNGQAKKVVFGK